MSYDPYFDDPSGTVRFFVDVDGTRVRASVSRESLHYRYRPDARGEDPLQTFEANAAAIEFAVRRRLAQGSLDPVLLREADLRT